LPGNAYDHNSGGGTSLSAPLVAGTAGLILAAARSVDRDLTANQIGNIITSTVDATGRFDASGNEINVLNAFRAVQHALTPAGQWTERATFPASVNLRGVLSFAIGNKGYIGIPCFIGFQCIGEFSEYDPQGNRWMRLGNHPSIQFQSPHFVLNGSAYVVSGTQVWQYAPGSDQWTRKSDIPGADKRAGFAFSVNGLGYIGGGFYNGGALWEYNPNNDTWVRKNDHPVLQYGGNDPSVRSVEAVTFSIGDKAYLTGTNSWFWQYSPSTDTWVTKAYVDAVYGQAFSIGSKGYVFNAHGALYEYEPTADRWTPAPVFPGTTICYPAGFSIGASLYVGVGGRFEGNTCNLDILNAWWQFRP
jgi:hypothetical protein